MSGGLAPGHILQRIHFRRRLDQLACELGGPGRFLEIGAGTGWLSEVALARGWTGVGFDLNTEACRQSARRNAEAIASGRYRVVNAAFSAERLATDEDRFDLVVSSMVLEHLTEDEVDELIDEARRVCGGRGVFAAFVPAGMRYWGIEDEIAGHLRRYERRELYELARRGGLTVRHATGLTFPTSNLLRGISNRLVARAESHRLVESRGERTIASGHRTVPFKTQFPRWAILVVNELTLRPLDLLQRFYGTSPRSMVLYCEWEWGS